MIDEHPVIEDLAAATGVDVDTYFDHREFEARAWLEDSHYWHLARREVLLDAVRMSPADRTAPMVEVGCGAGTVATFLNEKGFAVDYADVHREALVLARSRARDRIGERVDGRRFIRIDVCRDEIPAGYGTILLLDVLEHLPDDAGVLARVRRALERPGTPGVLVLTVPAFPILWSPYDVVEHHQRRYTRAGARAVLEASGFEVMRMTYFFAPLFFAAGAVKLVRNAASALRPTRAPEMFTELVETRSNPALTALMLRVLGAERRVLRGRDLPVGTSLLCVARCA